MGIHALHLTLYICHSTVGTAHPSFSQTIIFWILMAWRKTSTMASSYNSIENQGYEWDEHYQENAWSGYNTQNEWSDPHNEWFDPQAVSNLNMELLPYGSTPYQYNSLLLH